MFLRSLTLRGFKSFAEKTTLEFTPGISVIVGPNGSGKSNIVDAIAWVLGEQGPRALRGGQMSDVIFAGGPSRPTLGLAEVKMVIDNSAGLIPISAAEIEISRTVFRAGESEYRLGGRPCRLLDIHELLSDTGIGRTQHTIVGQGQLDSVLSARPEERRLFVEEAAGIAKHRRRRERAERKLAGLDQDLLRLRDLAGELRRQLKPLRQQAELAERHEALTIEAAGLARKMAAARLRDLYLDRDRRAPSWEAAVRREAEARARLAALDDEIARLDADLAASQEAHRAAEERQDATALAKSGAEDVLRAGIREEARAQQRLATAADRSGRLFALDDELQRTEAALMEVRAALMRREEDLERAELDFNRADQARRDAEDERRRLETLAAARRAESETLRRSLESHGAEAGRLSSLRAGLARAARGQGVEAERLERTIEELDGRATPVAAELKRLAVERADLAGTVAELDARAQGLLARREVAQARRDELSESPAAAFARRPGAKPIGVLSELVRVPPDLRLAFRTALGSLFDAVVYATLDDAVEEATAPGALGLTLAVAQPSVAQPSVAQPSAAAAVPVPGERPIAGAIHPDPRVAGLLAALLNDVYVVQSLDEAAAKHRVHPDARFVSLDGVLVGSALVRSAPGHDDRLAEARRECASVERQLAGVHRELREARARLEAIQAREGSLRGRLDTLDRDITAAADELSRVQTAQSATAREQQLVEDRLAAAESAAAAAREQLATLPAIDVDVPTLPSRPEPPVHLRVETEALRRERSRLEAAVVRIRREVERLAEEDPVALREASRRAEATRLQAEASLQDANDSLAEAQARYRASWAETTRLQQQHQEANRAWREQAAAVDDIRREHEEESRARHELDRRIGEAERLLREGHGADPEEAVESLEDDETVTELSRRSETVARRLGLLGRVNLLAVGELEALQERHDFLARELDDVRAARRDLQQVIEDVDSRMVELYEDAFRDVAAQFAALFELMFPGGEGRLVLTDPTDPLGGGIEVEARPGRGKVKRLSLLSGGERSLAALAFLFAIFRARPSPFYLMDEVEAALDDINLHRFLEVIREFAQTSQILIVTHQKRTMEIADVLYGVSIRKDGVSTVISQRLPEMAAR